MSTANRPSDPEPPQTRLDPALRGSGRLGATVRIVLGVVFFALGIVGALLPIIQGWIFFLLSLIMFFPNHPRVARLLHRMEPRAPRTVRLLHRLGFGVDDLEGISKLDVGRIVKKT